MLVGGGTVVVPEGAFDGQSTDVSIASTVVSYNDAGPLFWAPSQASPVGNESQGTLGTGLTSVSFSSGAAELSVSNLSRPFIVQLAVDPDHPASGDHQPAACGHWDVATDEWVVDGAFVGRSADKSKIICSYSHLTDFIGFLGPEVTANELSLLKVFSAEWLSNPAGAIVSLSVLAVSILTCIHSMRQYRRIQYRIEHPDHITRYHHNWDSFAQQRMMSEAKHTHVARKWAIKMQLEYQLGAMFCGHDGDPYHPSQRFVVFMMAMMVSLVINILFFESEEPVCTTQSVCTKTCIGDYCSNDTCVENTTVVCEEEDLGNGYLTSVLCALIGLPIVGSMHIVFGCLRRPLEQVRCRCLLDFRACVSLT